MNKENSKKIINRLHRVEGQIRGVEKMIDTGESFEKIIIQITAIKSGAQSIKKMLIHEHIDEMYEYFLKTGNSEYLEQIKIIITRHGE